MNFGIVVLEQFILLLRCPASEWVLEIQGFVLAADHEANLSTRICSDICVSVIDVGEYSSATVQDWNDHIKMDEVVLS